MNNFLNWYFGMGFILGLAGLLGHIVEGEKRILYLVAYFFAIWALWPISTVMFTITWVRIIIFGNKVKCSYCEKFFSKKEIRVHAKECKKNPLVEELEILRCFKNAVDNSGILDKARIKKVEIDPEGGKFL